MTYFLCYAGGVISGFGLMLAFLLILPRIPVPKGEPAYDEERWQ